MRVHGLDHGLCFRLTIRSSPITPSVFISGHCTLYASDRYDSPVVKAVLPLVRESATLQSACATYQALVSSAPETQFQVIYNYALQFYRADLSRWQTAGQDSTVCAGMLLCGIGVRESWSH